MKLLHTYITAISFSLILNIGCSSKVANKADAAITPSDSTPPTAVAPAEENVDKRTLAKIVNDEIAPKKPEKKKAMVKKTVAKPEPAKGFTVAPSVEKPVEPAKQEPIVPETVQAPEAIQANPEMGGFFASHYPMLALLALAGFGYFIFLAFWKRRNEKNA